ncbi:hypothetical protein ASPZODRAFT_19320 [Penicilliopsis zonata CBS 506.65]|uniref:Pyruvate decarboxylase n=1 Tax=Penicilliopsis zonata CBS 506.65 TaxID=1073090 RepID=A0A1L9S8V9_9EURO|nr:hypothetical protein ASPZODRAFT_19320 [Penicilliopsis zonata CBS 506.65]OJJ43598.1 hypothetical protein ASPZODRAFT_19320 [Penicilliopsis zonata CBS 506.65]
METPLAQYLFTRLRQLGLRSLFGVPGDYNLRLLDHVAPAGLDWVGNCNELNAGYAADGYARIKGLGALVTTFGVGELSAINAVAGAFTERAPVVQIVGKPPRATQDARTVVHHTLGDGEYGHFARMHTAITVAQASLRDPQTAPAQIDVVLQQCLLHSRPVYIEIPDDLVDVPVSTERLKTPLTLDMDTPSQSDEEVVSFLLERIHAAKAPLIFVDGESRAFNLVKEINELVRATQWPVWTSTWGKSLVDETLPNCYAIYDGECAPYKTYFDASDLVLCFGPHYSNTNSNFFQAIPSPAVTVNFTGTSVGTAKKTFYNLRVKAILSRLLAALDTSRLPVSLVVATELARVEQEGKEPTLPLQLTQKSLWPAMATFLRPGDIILTETGTSAYGLRSIRLPEQTRLFGPATWLSIGYMLPATLGAALAQREIQQGEHNADFTTFMPSTAEGRTILFIGDGSLQMTVQEISTMLRERLDIILFVVNNDGYTIERCIHGKNQAYNDVAPWRYLLAPAFFSAYGNEETDVSESSESLRSRNTLYVKDGDDLRALLQNEHLADGKGLRMAEVRLAREDAPEGALTRLLALQE